VTECLFERLVIGHCGIEQREVGRDEQDRTLWDREHVFSAALSIPDRAG
jgi:hypothetical protein